MMKKFYALLLGLFFASGVYGLSMADDIIERASNVDLSASQSVLLQVWNEGVLDGGVLKFDFVEGGVDYSAELAVAEFESGLSEEKYLDALRFFFSAGYWVADSGFFNSLSFSKLSAGDKHVLLAYSDGFLLRFSYIRAGGVVNAFADEQLIMSSEATGQVVKSEFDFLGLLILTLLIVSVLGIIFFVKKDELKKLLKKHK